MSTFKLIAGDVFSDEWQASKSKNFQYSTEERALIELLADKVEGYYVIQCKGNWDKVGGQRDVEGDDGAYQIKLYKEFEKNQGVYPYFFVTRERTVSYSNCIEEVPFSEKEDFSLFLLFKLRNLSLYKLIDWLEGLHNEYGEAFFSFLELHLDEYEVFYEEKHLKNINKWKKGITNQTSNLSSGTNFQNSNNVSLSIKQPKEEIRPVELTLKLKEGVITILVNILKPYFHKEVSSSDIENVLRGNVPSEKLYFETSGNRLIWFFRELHEKRMILSPKHVTNKLICDSFLFLNNKTKSITPFNKLTVHDALTKNGRKVSKANRIDLSSLVQNFY